MKYKLIVHLYSDILIFWYAVEIKYKFIVFVLTGQFCEVIEDFCVTDPCYPGVHCESIPGSFKCGPCPSGMEGNGSYCQGN